ncbi:MAG: hypothetical protein J6R40_01640, partial [Clostridia bacterium]|nr:hypothetical protein [Clostridia bacterium]
MKEKLYAVFTIVDYSKGADVAALSKEIKVPVRFTTHGHGMADMSVLELLGFGEHRKSMTITLLSEKDTPTYVSAVEQKLRISEPGHGILFTVPIASATAFTAALVTQNFMPQNELKEEVSSMHHTHELIITIITKGYSEDVKAAANAAGSRGGTMIHALGMGGEEAKKFLGIAIQPEKDIIFNVVRKEDKRKVMQAIAEAVGINTEG